jgi:hypothetical protein
MYYCLSKTFGARKVNKKDGLQTILVLDLMLCKYLIFSNNIIKLESVLANLWLDQFIKI